MILTPGATGGSDNGEVGEPRRGDTMSVLTIDKLVSPRRCLPRRIAGVILVFASSATGLLT